VLFSLSGCACVAHVLRVRSATHARLSRFSAFALRLLVSCCCQAVARCSRTFLYAPLLVLVFLGFCRLLFGKSPLCKQKAVFKTHNQAQLRLCFFPSSDCGRGAHVPFVRSAPRPRLSRLLPFALWQDTSLQAKKQCSRRTTKHNFGCAWLCALLRVWPTFDKR